jgi:hypothetical protein
MTESRKIQLETAVDATGAKQGFEQVKQGARDMAQSVAQAGQTAGKGMDAIGDGAKRAGDSMTREEGRIRSAIQRATLDLKTLGQSASTKLEAKIDLQGLDPSKFAPYLAALKEAEAATAAAQASAKGQSFLGDLTGQLEALRQQQIAATGGAEALQAYRAAQLGVSEQAAPLIAQINGIRTAMAAKVAADEAASASAKEQAAALKQQTSAQESFLASLRDRAATAGLDPNAQLRAKAQQLGVTQQAEPLIAQTQAAQTAQDQQRFLSGLQSQVDAIKKTRSELLALQAAKLGVTNQAAPLIAVLKAEEEAVHGFGAGSQFTTAQMQGLAHAGKAIFDEIAAGQSPIRAVALEMGRLSGTFGGAGNAFQAVLSLVTPFRLAMLAGAAAVGVLTLELIHAESKLRDLSTIQAQFSAQGKSFSTDQINSFVTQLAKVPGVTESAAGAIVSEFAKVGGIGTDTFSHLTGLVADYATATGTKLPEAAKTLAKAFADPEKGAGDLSKALEKFPADAQLTAERLARLGDTAGAQAAMLRGLEQAIGGVNERAMTPLQTSIDGVKKAWDRAMDDLDQSPGLHTVNELLAKVIGSVQWLLENAPKMGGLFNLSLATVGPTAPSAIGTAVGSYVHSKVMELLGSGGSTPENTAATSTPAPGAATKAVAAAAGDVTSGVDLVKRQVDAAKAYQSEAGQLKELTERRTALNKALAESNQLYGANSGQSKALRDGVAGINERIASLGKKDGNQAQRTLDAQLQGRVKAAQDALTEERSQIEFQQQYLQSIYTQGEIGIGAFFDAKVKAIEQGRDAEIAALETERKAVEDHMAATRRTSPKDTAKIEQDQTRLNQIGAQEAKLQADASRKTVLANSERTASYTALNQQIEEYRANLLALQGDETGAARLRNQIADQRDKVLAGQSRDSGNPIPQQTLDQAQAARNAATDVADAKLHIQNINDQLALQEERIGTLQQSNAIGEVAAMQRTGEARQTAIQQLEQYTEKLEKLAADDELNAKLQNRPVNLVLQLDASKARAALDQLKTQTDLLKTQFDNLFKSSSQSAIEDLLNGKTSPLGAAKEFATSVMQGFNKQVSEEISQSLFGKGGMFDGAGGFLASLFPKAKDQTHVDLTQMQVVGVEPATTALQQLADAASAAAVNLTNPQGLPLPPVADGTATAGDFARFDRSYLVALANGGATTATTGEAKVMDLFRTSTDQAASANTAAASTVLQLASAASRGGGALSVLPQIIQTIVSSTSLTGAASGGGLFGWLGSLFGGSSSGGAAAVNSFDDGSMMALIAHTGGVIGDVATRRSVESGVFADAMRYHIGGIVAGSSTHGLHPNEVPAILMGGPKGSREEVLHANDPRHRDNLGAQALQVLRGLPRYHTGGLAGDEADVLTPSAGIRYMQPGDTSGMRAPGASLAEAGASASGEVHYHTNITVNLPAGANRQTGQQAAAEVARALERASRRNR